MKGITQQLRELGEGEQTAVDNVSRSNLHHIARRLNIQIKIEKFDYGFLVTRKGEAAPDRVESVAVVPEAVDTMFDFGA